MDIPDTLLHALLTDPDTHRQGVDEHAQHAVGAFTALHAAKQYRAEYYVVSPRHSRQHLRPGQVIQACGAYAERPRNLAQTGGQWRINHAPRLSDARAIALYIDQPERRRWFIHIAQHGPEECFVIFLAHP